MESGPIDFVDLLVRKTYDVISRNEGWYYWWGDFFDSGHCVYPARFKLVMGCSSRIGEWAQAGYLDKIYRRAASGNYEGRMVGLLMLLVIASMLFSIFPKLWIAQTTDMSESGLKTIRRLHFTMVVLPILLLILTGMVASSIYLGVTVISSSFDQRLTILSPAISDQEHKTWKARWANMQNINDYRSIQKDLDKRASELKVNLPKQQEP